MIRFSQYDVRFNSPQINKRFYVGIVSVNTKNPTKCVGLVQSGHHLIQCNLFLSRYSWKSSHLALNNNHSLTYKCCHIHIVSLLIIVCGNKIFSIAFPVCPSDVVFDVLPENIHCFMDYTCSSIGCCIDVVQIRKSFTVTLSVDQCNNKMTIQLERSERTISLLDYQWGEYCLKLGKKSWKYWWFSSPVLKMPLKLKPPFVSGQISDALI